MCGAQIQKCPFWLGVNENMKKCHGIDLTETPDSLPLKYDSTLTWPKKTRKVLGLSEPEPFGINSKKLYDAIFEQSKTEVLIDSSKDFKRALFLRPYLADYLIAFIHLIRDVRGVIYSEKKTFYTVRFPGNAKALVFSRTPKTVDYALQIWKYGNIKISIYLRVLGIIKNSCFVRYKDFTNKPQDVFSNLAYWLGLSNIERIINFGSVGYHNVFGNPSRFNTTKIKPTSKKWRTELPTEELQFIQRRAG